MIRGTDNRDMDDMESYLTARVEVLTAELKRLRSTDVGLLVKRIEELEATLGKQKEPTP